MPTLSPDGQTLFYLTRGEGTLEYVAGELRAVNLASGESERLLREFSNQPLRHLGRRQADRVRRD